MTKRKSDFTLPSYDDIFTTHEMRDDAKLEKVQNIPLAELHPFKDHPCKILNNETTERMIESIRKVGAITPVSLCKPNFHAEVKASVSKGFEHLRYTQILPKRKKLRGSNLLLLRFFSVALVLTSVC